MVQAARVVAPDAVAPELQAREPPAGRTDPADAAAADAAQPAGDAGHGAGGDRRDLLRRHPRHHAACRHRPRLPHGHADADAVGRRHGRRRVLRHQPGAGSRRRGTRRSPGPARHRHRRRGRIGVLGPVRRLRPAIFRALGGHGAVLDHALTYSERGAGGRRADLAAQHAGLHRARHRQHARALADAARGCDAADRARRRAGARHRTDPALRPCRRRLGPGHRLRCRRAVPALVPALRPRARDAAVHGRQPHARHVLRHPEGRRACRLLAAADRADGAGADARWSPASASRRWPATASARAWSSCWCRSCLPSASPACRWWAWRSAPATSPARAGWPGPRPASPPYSSAASD